MSTVTPYVTTASTIRDEPKIRRYIVDLEFNATKARRSLPEIISIAITCLDDGRELYLENAQFHEKRATPFVREHVLPKLKGCPNGKAIGHVRYECSEKPWNCPLVGLTDMRYLIHEFCSFEGTTPEFWGYMCSHDFVLLESLFGDFEHWPKGWPFLMHDIEQLRLMLGLTVLPAQDPDDEHNALVDVRHLARVWRFLAAHPLNSTFRRLMYRWDEPTMSFSDVRAPLVLFLKNSGYPDWEAFTPMGEPDRVRYRARDPQIVEGGA